MTGWTNRTERHIPEDELHAYLDQALSRSQGAEIETHLSACRVCQARRGSVAALRDRTTALLSGLTPRPIILPPSFQEIRERNRHLLVLTVWKARFRRAGLWAAGVAAAVGAGWIARSTLDPHQPAEGPGFLAQQPAPAVPGDAGLAVSLDAVPPSTPPAAAPSDSFDLDQRATPAPLPERPLRSPRRAEPTTTVAMGPSPQFQLASLEIPVSFTEREMPALSRRSSEPSAAPFQRIIRVFAWEEALQIAGSNLPFIEGIPVVAVLFDPGAPGERPAVMVTQQDASGEFLYSIEGPEPKVSALIERQSSPELKASESARTPPDYVEGPDGELRRALRILRVVGRLPVDSLNTLVRRAAIR